MSSQFFSTKTHILPGQHVRQYSRATAHSQDDVLRVALKQYLPLNYDPRPGDVTIIAVPSNGFPKEMYEPLWDDLLVYSRNKFRIRGIWMMDLVNQNESGELNRGQLGNEPSWFDYSRDLLLAVNHFRDEMPRPIVGVGHSLGGAVLLNLAHMHPRLLTSIVAVETPLHPRTQDVGFPGTLPLVKKRHEWPTRREAEEYFSKVSFFRSLDPRVFANWLTYGLTENHDGTARLTSNKHQEAVSYSKPSHPLDDGGHTTPLEKMQAHPERHTDLHPDHVGQAAFYRPEMELVFHSLPTLRPSCFYLHASSSGPMLSLSDEANRNKTNNTGIGQGGNGGGDRVKEMRAPRGGHFLPLEVPAMVAQLAGDWLAQELQVWADADACERKEWLAVPVDKRAMVSQDSMQWIKAAAPASMAKAKAKNGKEKSGNDSRVASQAKL